VGKPDEEVWVTQGQLVTEVPERNEVWTLQFHRGRYDPKAQTALTEKSVCQVRRKGRIVTLFSAPHIFVRFKERVMVMEGGVTVVGKLARLKVQMMVMGVVKTMTAESAQRAALGARRYRHGCHRH